MKNINPALLEIFKHRFSSIAEEMGLTLQRTAYSSNIKERRDYSCAVFDQDGDMIAQAAHIPVHLGSMPLSVKSAIENHTFADGDMVILNDPFKGGTHLPDITIVAPVYFKSGKPDFYIANRAHHADIGGMSPGSMPLSTSIFQEGIIIPPMPVVKQGVIDDTLLSFLTNNTRTPEERKGDFLAQIMANMIGIKRMKEIVATHQFEAVSEYAAVLMDYSEIRTRNVITKIPDGTYAYKDVMDDDGFGNTQLPISVTIKIKNDHAVFDFTGTHSQTTGSINAVYAVTLSCVLYVIRSFVDEDIPANAGCLRPVTIITQKGSLVDAQFPAAVAGGNVETSQRIVDVILGAFAKAIPNDIPAASQGTMNNVTIGGIDPRTGRPFAYYETIGGGMGGSASANGAGAVHSHMTNTLNTPIEALEYSYPFLVTEYAIRKNSGGRGKCRGGDGIIREIELLVDAEVTVLSERRKNKPYGLLGGAAGKCGVNIVIEAGKKKTKTGKFKANLKKGDRVRIETPGGGGYGN